MTEASEQYQAAVLKPRTLARAAALFSLALGFIVLTGWWLSVPSLQNLWVGRPGLPANGGLIFLLLGAALMAKIKRARHGLQRHAARVGGDIAALLVVALALVTLLEFLFGWKAGIDQWLVQDRLAAAHKAIPGRIAFPTALAALALGLGFALLDVRVRGMWINQFMALLSSLVAMLALIGHICNVPEFYGQVGAYPGTALPIPGVAGFLALGLGLLCARPERGLMTVLWSYTPGGMLARWLILAPAVGLLLTGVVYLALTRALPIDHAVRTWALGLSNLLFVTAPIWAAAHALHQAGLERDHAQQVLEERVGQRTAELTQANIALQSQIAERTQAEEALRDARDRLEEQAADLERRVAERTTKLGETIGDLESFSYSVAHDMRAPLRGMQGFARLLLDDHSSQLDSEAQGYLERIASAASRMDVLIQDALSYTQVLRAETPLKPVDLDKVVRQLVANFPGWQPPQAEVILVGQLPAALSHEAFITQCISNLVSNAVKFVAPGRTPRVRIWGESLETRVRVCVEDNGIGIAPKDHDRIFRMFERINRADQYEGTGIGLAIVRKAVERMGGHVDFRSEPGKGTRFWIELAKAPQP